MHDDYPGLRGRPFQEDGRPTTFVRYRSQQEAFKFLGNVLKDNRGIGLLHGPASSGKSVLIRQFIKELQSGAAVAVVDGARLKTPELLSSVLAQFGYEVELKSPDELLKMLKIFVVQQTRHHQPPVLILENIQDMYPSTLGALCKLASLSVQNRFALQIVLVSNKDHRRIINSPSMRPVADRMIGNYELKPMSSRETLNYLYTKLRASGVDRPDDVFPVEICEKLHAVSGGWPGQLDAIAMSVIDEPDDLPVLVDAMEPSAFPDAAFSEQPTVPKLIVTLSGKPSYEVTIATARSLIGRSDLSDIIIEDKFVSKQHALVIREKNAVTLVDLKSANGTFVNSRRVQRTVLRHNDIVSIGDHRLKVISANSPSRSQIDDPDLADTTTMKNIADARRAKARKKRLLRVINSRKG